MEEYTVQTKLSDYVWDYIEKLGVKHVFLFPGGGAMHLVDSLGRKETLKDIPLLHEQACTIAAETYARIDYNLGVALVTTGPGGTNAVTGVAAAWLESTPLIVISGQVKTSDMKGDLGVRQIGNQEIGIVDIVKSITKYAVTVTNPKKIKYHLDRAIYEARTGRQGPVWIDIPLDVQAAMIDGDDLESFQSVIKTNKVKVDILEKLASELLKAIKPVLIVGQGIERNKGKEIFRQLVDYLEIPVLTSWIAVEVLEHNHRCNMGKPGMIAGRYSNFTMQYSDFVLAIGTRLDSSMIGHNQNDFAPKAKKYIVDIDENELNKFSFSVQEKIVADGTAFIEQLLSYLKGQSIRLNCNEWLKECQKWKEQYSIIRDHYLKIEQTVVDPYIFFDKLSEQLDSDAVVIPGSSGAGIDVFWLCIKNKRNQRMLATGALGSMGYGIPAAIGACIASGKPTICVEGDGSLQLNIQELASIKGMKLPIKIFVINNGGYLSIRNMQDAHFEGRYVASESSSGLFLPDIEAIAKSYGFSCFVLNKNDNISDVISQVLNEKGPTLCEVKTGKDLVLQPKVMSRVLADGTMQSGDLLNMWPYLTE